MTFQRKALPVKDPGFDVQRAITEAHNYFPSCRWGQAFSNYWDIPQDLEQQIWEDKGFHSVVNKIGEFYNWCWAMEQN